MAKSSIGRGQFRGKLGGDVYAVRNGQQIIRAYQPVVANPKSDLQVDQRQKGNLAGKISRVFKAELIAGLAGGNKSARRSRFLKILLDSIYLQNVNAVRSAVINPLAIKLSEGVQGSFARSVTGGLVFDSGTLAVSWEIGGDVYEEGFTQRLLVVVLFVLSTGSGTSEVRGYYTRNAEVDLSTRVTTVQLPGGTSGWSGAAYAWGIPIVGHGDNAFTSGALYGDSATLYSTSGLSDLSALTIADSVFLGSADYAN